MGEHFKINTNDFATYLQTVVKLDALQQMTHKLDKDLENSQRVMEKIKTMYSSISFLESNPMPSSYGHENHTKLEVNIPNLLMPDMLESNMDVDTDVDVDVIIASMKNYAENLKKNIVVMEVQQRPKDIVPLDIEQYATSLDQLGKRLANIKLTKKDDVNHKNPELEFKLTQLCEDVDMFNKMVQAKIAVSEYNTNQVEIQENNSALKYDNIVNKLLVGINEVSHILQNKNR